MNKKNNFNFNLDGIMGSLPGYLPLAVQAVILVVFIIFLVPKLNAIAVISAEIREKRDSLAGVQKGSYDVSQIKNDLQNLEKKAAEYDQRLPVLVETTMLIDSLKAVTRESNLRFSSIEPLAAEKFELPYSSDTYYRLPIRIKLKCGYFELIDFIHKIENEKRLMKVSSLTISSNPDESWEHNAELVISTFARTGGRGK